MKPEEKELLLLRNLHEECRGFFRYDGIDRSRAIGHLTGMREAMYLVNDFDQRIDDMEEEEK